MVTKCVVLGRCPTQLAFFRSPAHMKNIENNIWDTMNIFLKCKLYLRTYKSENLIFDSTYVCFRSGIGNIFVNMHIKN